MTYLTLGNFGVMQVWFGRYTLHESCVLLPIDRYMEKKRFKSWGMNVPDTRSLRPCDNSQV